MFSGEIEVDESYFGGKRKGKRGRGTGERKPRIWLVEARRKGLHQNHSRCLKGLVATIIECKVVPDSIVYSDCWKANNVLDVSDFKHFRINHSVLFADVHNHINGIENFWNQAKRHMRKFKGVPKAQFSLYLKECEWRFNNSDLSDQLLLIRQWVKRCFI